MRVGGDAPTLSREVMKHGIAWALSCWLACSIAASHAAAEDEGWILELGTGFGSGVGNDAYLRRLHEFEFQREERLVDFDMRYTVHVARRVDRHLVFGLGYMNLESGSYERFIEFSQAFSWSAHAMSVFVQADLTAASPVGPALCHSEGPKAAPSREPSARPCCFSPARLRTRSTDRRLSEATYRSTDT
jgi:hypothetical protein